jgi:hypothetical protein
MCGACDMNPDMNPFWFLSKQNLSKFLWLFLLKNAAIIVRIGTTIFFVPNTSLDPIF